MGPVLQLTRRLLLALAVLLSAGALGAAHARAAAPLSLQIVGNHFVNGAGQTIRLLGVNHQSFEYGCVDGFGYDDGLMDDADAAAIASWGADAVRVPLNEDCWLGINGQPNSSEGASPPLTQAGYQQAVENYVADLNAHGLYAILDLHWAAPGTTVALEQQPMPDMDHSPAFWTSVASTFKSNPAVVFDLYNEPFDPTDPHSGDDQQPQDKVSWDCWENGGCSTALYDEHGRTGARYTVAGMQTLLDAVRATGARQPIMTGGLNFANDLSQWATHAPDDPLNQEAAAMHAYSGQACSDQQPQSNGLGSCFSQVASIAQNVPVVIGEFGQNATGSLCTTPGDQSYDANLMNWADQNGVSYTAWGWVVETRDELASDGCSAYELISDAAGTPFAPNGTGVHSHLAALASGGSTHTRSGSLRPPSLTSFAAALARHHTLRLIVSSDETCQGTASVATSRTFGTGKRRVRVSIGAAHFALAAGARKAVTVSVTRPARRLLAAHPSVTVRVSITLVSAAGRTTHARRTLTLHPPH